MEISIENSGVNLKFTVSPSDTLLTLKEQIGEEEGVELSDQKLYFQGYWLNDDSITLGDILKAGDELTLILPTAHAATPAKTFKTSQDVLIVNGTKRNFVPQLLQKGQTIPIALKSDTLGLVIHQEGEELGSRVYQVYRYLVNTSSNLIIDINDDKTQVFRDGQPLEMTDVTIYDEQRVKSKTETATGISKIAANIGNFLSGIGAIVFPEIHLSMGSSYIKKYSCPIDIEYPETQEERKQLLARIEIIMEGITQSNTDLEFIKKIVIDENSEEVLFMDFMDLSSLTELPWTSVKFEAESLSRGSTVLHFNLIFEEPPMNHEDVHIYRLMELIILSSLENLQFIKSVKSENQMERNIPIFLSARVKTKVDNFDEELMQKMLMQLRSTVKLLSASEDAASNELINNDRLIDEVLKKIKRFSGNEEVKWLSELTPASQRETLRRVVKDSKLAEKDMAEISFEIERPTKKKVSHVQNLPNSANWLFPFDFRKLSDLPDDVFQDISAHLTKRLPTREEVWYKEFLSFLFNVQDMIELGAKVSRVFPYPEILMTYSKKGGTIGGLLKALENLQKSDIQHEEKESIEKYKKEVEKIRTKLFDEILESVYCPSPISGVTTMLEFEEMVRKFKLKLKTNEMMKFSEVQESIFPGDQLWLYHKRPLLMRGYAHVVIITENMKYIHVSSPKLKLKMRSRALICEDSQDKLTNEDLCFVVNPKNDKPQEFYSKRAQVCKGICLDYDAESTNCETFANGVHGIWNKNIQVPTGKVQNVASSFTTSSKLFKHNEEPLCDQMMKKIREAKLILPYEK